ncbi:transposase domain-containing protein, partial [Catenulispora pinisilvae]|uniref:transposase domain-containing protein n=1 Tax=Catenulispora pinisilvae TaxID=2705253 RepID=UPI0018913383
QRRLRVLPSRVGVYFLLARALVPEDGYGLGWRQLVSSLGPAGPAPSAKALRDLRRRVGAAPVKMLFETLAGPLAGPRTPGARFG